MAGYRAGALAVFAVAPAAWLVGAGGRLLGPFSVDRFMHLWLYWNGAQGGMFHTPMISPPGGLDLLPIAPGWLDIFVGAALFDVVGLAWSYNLVLGLYALLAALGGYRLARAMGASRPASVLAGLLLQWDGLLLYHLSGGRPDQAGIGLVALALGGALQVWRQPGRRGVLLCGLAGALVVYAGWELAVLTALCLAFLSPFLFSAAPRPPGAPLRWAQAALVCAVAAGPLVARFLPRALAVRALDEAAFAQQVVQWASVPILGWLAPGRVGPATLPLLCVLLLPWTAPRADRRLAVGIVLGCAVALLLAAGPSPGLWAPGPPEAAWGPFAWLHAVPPLGWFHWPERFLYAISLAVVPAAALAVDRLAGRSRPAALLLAAALLGSAAWQARWPQGQAGAGYPTSPLEAPLEPGAIVNLPVQPDPVHHLGDLALQLRHRQPLMFGMFHAHLIDSAPQQSLQGSPLLTWFSRLMEPHPPAPTRFQPADVEALRASGYRYLSLRRQGWPPDRFALAESVLRASFGEPLPGSPPDLLLWRLPEPPPPGAR